MALFRGAGNALKQQLGWAPRPTHPAPVVAKARPGQQEFDFSPLLRNNPTEIFVAVNQTMMTPNHDYTIDMTKGKIHFDSRVMKIYGGEEIEIRSTGPDVDPLKRVLLLPRKNGAFEFSEEDLQEFAASSIGAVFEVDKIAKYGDNAAKLATFSGKHLQVLSLEVTEEGLIGTEQRVIHV